MRSCRRLLVVAVAVVVASFAPSARAQSDGSVSAPHGVAPAASASAAPAAGAAAPAPAAGPAALPPPINASPAAPAAAPVEGARVDKEEPTDRLVYISISPLHLILPIVELTAELRVHEKIGIAAIGGYGSMDPQQFSETKTPGVTMSRFTVWEVGGQFVGYPVGHFDHGMQLGAEILYAGVSGSASDASSSATGTAQGLAMGPFIGYKLSTKVGFSFNVQGGAQYVTARGEARSTAGGATQSDSRSDFAPLLNLNVGWAF